jgi:hypothetical protein
LRYVKAASSKQCYQSGKIIQQGETDMTQKEKGEQQQKPGAPVDAFAQMNADGFQQMLGLGTAWMEAMSDMGAEVMSFVADRIKEDVKTQHKILHCKNVSDLQQIQSEFIQRAMDQYQAETGKLVEMGNKAFAAKSDGENG